MTPDERDRIRAMVRKLESESDGEIVAMARRLSRIAKSSGRNIAELLTEALGAGQRPVWTPAPPPPPPSPPRPPEGPPRGSQTHRQGSGTAGSNGGSRKIDWADMLRFAGTSPKLTAWERGFCESLLHQNAGLPWFEMSPKQRAVAERIAQKVGWTTGQKDR